MGVVRNDTAGAPRRGWRAVLAAGLLVTVLALLDPSPASAHTPHDNVVDTEFSPEFAQDDTMYTVVREYLLRSTDGGTSWRRLINGIDNKHVMSGIEVSTSDPDRVFVSSRGDGVYRSDDGGDSWRSVSQGLDKRRNLLDLSMAPHDDDLLVAVGPEGVVVVTEDGGGSWRPAAGVPEGTDVSAVEIAPTADGPVLVGAQGAVLRSDDRGASWEEIDLDGDDPVRDIAFSPGFEEDRTVFVGTEGGGVAVSDDGGRTFEETGGQPDDDRVMSLHVSAGFAEDGTLWASTWDDGAYRSDDRGDSWELVDEGLTTDSMADDLGRAHFLGIAAFGAPGDDGHLLAIDGFNGLFLSEDRGDEWTESDTQASTNIGAVALSPDYARDGTVFVSTYVNGILRSTDGGESWTHQNKGLTAWYEFIRRPDYFARLTGVYLPPTFADDGIVYAGARPYLHTSEDRGETWTPVILDGIMVEGEFPPDYLLPAFSPEYERDGTMIAGTDSGKVFRKEGDGQPEKIADIDVEITAIALSPDFPEDRTVVVTTPEGVQVSTDAGETWEVREGSPRSILSLAVLPVDGGPPRTFVGTKNGLHRSDDLGETWQEVAGPFGPRPWVEAVVASPEVADDGLVLLSLRGLGLYRSTDSGATFEPTAPELLADNVVLASFYHPTTEPIVFSPTFAEDRTIYGQAQTELYRSTDAGVTWTRLELPRAEHGMDEVRDAPNELLVTPRPGEARSTITEDGEVESTGVTVGPLSLSDRDDVLVLTWKRVLIALGVALVALAAMFVLRVGTRTDPKRLAVAFRVAASVVVFAAVLFAVASR